MSLPRYERYKDSGVEWIGEIPEGWEVKKLKYVAKIHTEKAEDGAEKVALENIESKTGRFIGTETAFDGEGVGFKNGDVLYGKLRPYLAKVWVAEFDGAAVGDFFVIRPQQGFSPDYLKYRLLSAEFTDIANGSTFGSKMPRVDKDFMTDLSHAVPTLTEQTAIVSFLDRKTAEIDQLIAKKEKLIALYEEEKTAIINRAVTRGLDPEVKTRPSGVDWLGDIPEHWLISRINYYIRVKDGTHDTPTYVPESEDNFPLITSKDFIDEDIDFSNAKYISPKDHEEIIKRSNTEQGDIIMSMIGGNIGNLVLVKTPRSFSIKNVALFKTAHDPDIAKFVYYMLKSNLLKIQIELNSRGGAQGFLSLGDLRSLLYFVLPREEMRRIVSHIETECSRLDAIIDKFKKQIELFKEYRTTLISKVVTGKIDVRDEVAA